MLQRYSHIRVTVADKAMEAMDTPPRCSDPYKIHYKSPIRAAHCCSSVTRNEKSPRQSGGFSNAPGEIRTPDPLIRSQMLYPAELRAHE